MHTSVLVKTAQIAAMPALFNGGHIRIFGGTPPDSCERSEDQNGAQLLGFVTNHGLPVGANGAGLTLQASGPYLANPVVDSWLLTVIEPGVATWFRFVGPEADDGSDSYEFARLDGAIGNPGDAAEMIVPSTTLTIGAPFGPLSFFYTIPPIIG